MDDSDEWDEEDVAEAASSSLQKYNDHIQQQQKEQQKLRQQQRLKSAPKSASRIMLRIPLKVKKLWEQKLKISRADSKKEYSYGFTRAVQCICSRKVFYQVVRKSLQVWKPKKFIREVFNCLRAGAGDSLARKVALVQSMIKASSMSQVAKDSLRGPNDVENAAITAALDMAVQLCSIWSTGKTLDKVRLLRVRAIARLFKRLNNVPKEELNFYHQKYHVLFRFIRLQEKVYNKTVDTSVKNADKDSADENYGDDGADDGAVADKTVVDSDDDGSAADVAKPQALKYLCAPKTRRKRRRSENHVFDVSPLLVRLGVSG